MAKIIISRSKRRNFLKETNEDLDFRALESLYIIITCLVRRKQSMPYMYTFSVFNGTHHKNMIRFAKLYLVFIFNILKSEFEYRKQKRLLPVIIFVKIKKWHFIYKKKKPNLWVPLIVTCLIKNLSLSLSLWCWDLMKFVWIYGFFDGDLGWFLLLLLLFI